MRFAMFQHLVTNDGTKQKRLMCAAVLLRQLKVRDTKQMLFTDENNFSK